jgi:hypothetical protein
MIFNNILPVLTANFRNYLGSLVLVDKVSTLFALLDKGMKMVEPTFSDD